MKLEKLLAPAEMKDKCGLYARVTLPPGAGKLFPFWSTRDFCSL